MHTPLISLQEIHIDIYKKSVLCRDKSFAASALVFNIIEKTEEREIGLLFPRSSRPPSLKADTYFLF